MNTTAPHHPTLCQARLKLRFGLNAVVVACELAAHHQGDHLAAGRAWNSATNIVKRAS